MKLIKLLPFLRTFFCSFDSFLLPFSPVSYVPVVNFLLLAEEIFQTYLKGCGFAEEHN